MSAPKAKPKAKPRPRKAPARRTNAAALEETLTTLGELGRFESVDAAFLQALRSMARAVDAEPTNAQLWKAYLDALSRLRSDDTDDDELDEIAAEMRSAPRHSPAP